MDAVYDLTILYEARGPQGRKKGAPHLFGQWWVLHLVCVEVFVCVCVCVCVCVQCVHNCLDSHHSNSNRTGISMPCADICILYFNGMSALLVQTEWDCKYKHMTV